MLFFFLCICVVEWFCKNAVNKRTYTEHWRTLSTVTPESIKQLLYNLEYRNCVYILVVCESIEPLVISKIVDVPSTWINLFPSELCPCQYFDISQ